MHLSGEPGAEITVSQFDLAEGDLGTIIIENLSITGGANNLVSVGAASVVRSLVLRNLDVNTVGKSLFYGNADGSEFQAVVFDNVFVTGLGGGQGTIDIRKGTYGALTIQNCTIVGGRDFIRADAGKVTGAVNIVNNTFDGVTLNNGNGILYVRSTPESYILKNNLFLNENGENNLLSKASGITVPTAVANNYFYGCTAGKSPSRTAVSSSPGIRSRMRRTMTTRSWMPSASLPTSVPPAGIPMPAVCLPRSRSHPLQT